MNFVVNYRDFAHVLLKGKDSPSSFEAVSSSDLIFSINWVVN